jgi:hypothetical protein
VCLLRGINVGGKRRQRLGETYELYGSLLKWRQSSLRRAAADKSSAHTPTMGWVAHGQPAAKIAAEARRY